MHRENRKLMNSLHEAYTHEKYPSFPIISIPKYTHSDMKANGLTKCIIDFLKFKNHHAERINNISRWVNGRYIKSSMQKGTADVSATIQGKSVKIEIKIGKDRQSEEQKKYQQQIIKAGGYYFIATSFDEFIIWYNLNFNI